MRTMWMGRFLSSVIVALLAAVTTLLGVKGDAVFLAVAVIVPVAMLAGFGAEAWLNDRRHRSLG